MQYRIYMDVSGDIDPVIAEQKELCFVPMEYSIGGEMRCCKGIESSEILKTFYNGQRTGDLTQTSQISPYLYETYFEKDMETGHSILYLALSSGLSSTYQSAMLAKENLEEKFPNAKLFVLDTLGATAGMGIMAERALNNREKGMTIEDNYADLANMAHYMQYWFAVPDLMYLKAGGRVSAASAMVGTALNIHPILKIDETGHLVVAEKKRGKKASIQAVLNCLRRHLDENSTDPIYAIHADAPEIAAQLQDAVQSEFPGRDVRITGLSPIIGAHTGPGMFALTFLGKAE